MVTEDYISFETAKLMHDKGFNLAEFHGRWAIDYDNAPNTEEEDPEGKIIVAEWQYPLITLQMAVKWLREEKNCFIDIHNSNGDGYFYEFVDLRDRGHLFSNNCCRLLPTYEEACEAAIKYCLENLI